MRMREGARMVVMAGTNNGKQYSQMSLSWGWPHPHVRQMTMTTKGQL